MKIRSYLALAAAALVMTNCSQEEVAQISQSSKVITATIESSSRSAVTDAGVFSWTSGDEISLHDGTNVDTYTYSGTGNDFTEPSASKVETPVVAYYPANASHTTTSFYLPATYDAGSTNAAMMATPPASGSTYAFKHLGGMMRFIVKDVPAEATQFVLKAVGKKITGKFSIENGIISTEATSSTDNQVTINFTINAKQDMTFYVPLPVGKYEGYQVYIKNESSLNLTETSSETAVNTIARKTLLLMPTFTCTANGLTKGEVSSNNVIDLEEGSTEATIVGDAEVLVTPGDDADATATLNYTPAADGSSALSISDGSSANESGESEGNVVVSTAAATIVESCDINTPSLTVELSAADNGTATYEEVTALTAQQTLIVGEDVTVNNLIVKGGNVRVQGTVSAISRAEGNADEVTYLIYEEGAQIPTSLEEKIVAVSAAEWDLRKAIAAGGEITLASDIEVTEMIQVVNDVTINLNGKKLSKKTTTTSGKNVLFYVNGSGAKLTIDGEGQVNVESGMTDIAIWAAQNTEVLIKSGEFYGKGCATSSDLIYAQNGKITVEGGSFKLDTKNTEDFAEAQYALLNAYGATQETAQDYIVVKGGKFYGFDPANNVSEGVGTNFVAVGYSSVANSEYYEVKKGVYNEAALKAAIAAGGDITLASNIEITSAIQISNTVAINLGEYEIKNATSTSSGKCQVFLIRDGGNLTIDGNGIINAAATCQSVKAVWLYDGGTVNIKGGTFKQAGVESHGSELIYVQQGNLYISGGTFIQSYTVHEISNSYAAVNCLDANYKNGTAKVSITGGTFHKFNPADNVSEGTNTNFVAEGYVSNTSDNGATYVVTASNEN